MKIIDLLKGLSNREDISTKERIACRNAAEIIRMQLDHSDGVDVFIKDVEYIDAEFEDTNEKTIDKL